MRNESNGEVFGRARSVKWYVVANRTGAVIYQEAAGEKGRFVCRLTNPSGSFTESDLDSDKPGRKFSSVRGGTPHHGLERRSNRHEEIAKRFAAEISRRLVAGRADHLYSELILAAEPHFLGLLRRAIPPKLRDLVKHEIAREFVEGSDAIINENIRRMIRRGVVHPAA